MTSPISQPQFQAILREDFPAFLSKAFQTISPGERFAPNWHMHATNHLLMSVASGTLRRLVVTQPPRSLKSILISVAFVAWMLGRNPSLHFLCVSYANELSLKFSRMFRTVVNSAWYRETFPNMRLTKDNEAELVTTRGGGRYSTSVGGSITGDGADIIIIDDPIKADEAQSDVARRKLHDWYGTTLCNRLNNPSTGAIIVVAQRLHEDDLIGRLLESEGDAWKHLDLPAIAIEDEHIPIGHGRTYFRRTGEILHPARLSLSLLDDTKRSMGSLAFSAQYQQRPIPAAGNIVKREWLKYYDTVPTAGAHQIVQSWDIATTTNAGSDFSVCTTWHIVREQYYLIDVWRGQLEFPAVKRQLTILAQRHHADTILIEQDGPGGILAQELIRDRPPGIPRPISRPANGTKLDRMTAHSAKFESGQVLLPREAPWLGTFLHELLGFPNTKNDDQADSVSQFLSWNRPPSINTGLGMPVLIFADPYEEGRLRRFS